MHILRFLVVFLIFIHLGVAKEKKAQTQKKKNFKLLTTVMFSTQRVFRGALTWPGAYAFPGIGVELFNKIRLTGPRILFFHKVRPWTFSAGIHYFDDRKPWLRFSGHEEGFRNQRKATINSFVGFKVKFFKHARYELQFHQDLKASKGVYFKSKLSVPIAPFTSLGVTLGYGDSKNNRYVYGPLARAGLGHKDFFARLVIPFLPYGGVWINKFTVVRIHMAQNKNAGYVRSDDRPKVFHSMANWSF